MIKKILFSLTLLLVPLIVFAEEPNYIVTRNGYTLDSDHFILFSLAPKVSGSGSATVAYCYHPPYDPPRTDAEIYYLSKINDKGLACTYYNAYKDEELTMTNVDSGTDSHTAGIANAIRLYRLSTSPADFIQEYPELSEIASDYVYTGTDKNKYATCDLAVQTDGSYKLQTGYCDNTKKVVTLTADSNNLTLSGDYYVSSAITVTLDSNYDIASYTLGLNEDAPTGTIVVSDVNSTTGLSLSNVTETTLYIKVPKESITIDSTIVLDASLADLECTTEVVTMNKYRYIDYGTTGVSDLERGRIWQDIIVPYYETKTDDITPASTALTLNLSTITISKKDITNVSHLVGAEMNITCENDYTVNFTTSENDKVLLVEPMVGTTCVLKEVKAPTNYTTITSTLKFQVSTTGSISVIGTTSKYFEVDENNITVYNGNYPVTDAWTWIGTFVLGGGLIAFGIALIVKYGKKK